MMRPLLFLLTTLLSLGLSAQTAPLVTGTESFEQWDSSRAGFLPRYWDAFNRPIVFNGSTVGIITTVFPDSASPKDLNYSARIVSTPVMGGQPVAGILTCGKLHIDFQNHSGYIDGGIPYTGRPARLQGWYKYAPQQNDSALIIVRLKSQGQNIGSGSLTIGQAQASWTPFSVDIQYAGSINPDTLLIIFLSSADSSRVWAGSTLEVDQIQLSGGDLTQIRPMSKKTTLKAFPSPAQQQIRLYGTGTIHTGSLLIRDINGKIVLQKTSLHSDILNISKLTPGLYLLELNKGTQHYRTKFIKQ